MSPATALERKTALHDIFDAIGDFARDCGGGGLPTCDRRSLDIAMSELVETYDSLGDLKVPPQEVHDAFASYLGKTLWASVVQHRILNRLAHSLSSRCGWPEELLAIKSAIEAANSRVSDASARTASDAMFGAETMRAVLGKELPSTALIKPTHVLDISSDAFEAAVQWLQDLQLETNRLVSSREIGLAFPAQRYLSRLAGNGSWFLDTVLGTWMMSITCEAYLETGQAYFFRNLLRAELISSFISFSKDHVALLRTLKREGRPFNGPSAEALAFEEAAMIPKETTTNMTTTAAPEPAVNSTESSAVAKGEAPKNLPFAGHSHSFVAILPTLSNIIGCLQSLGYKASDVYDSHKVEQMTGCLCKEYAHQLGTDTPAWRSALMTSYSEFLESGMMGVLRSDDVFDYVNSNMEAFISRLRELLPGNDIPYDRLEAFGNTEAALSFDDTTAVLDLLGAVYKSLKKPDAKDQAHSDSVAKLLELGLAVHKFNLIVLAYTSGFNRPLPALLFFPVLCHLMHEVLCKDSEVGEVQYLRQRVLDWHSLEALTSITGAFVEAHVADRENARKIGKDAGVYFEPLEEARRAAAKSTAQEHPSDSGSKAGGGRRQGRARWAPAKSSTPDTTSRPWQQLEQKIKSPVMGGRLLFLVPKVVYLSCPVDGEVLTVSVDFNDAFMRTSEPPTAMRNFLSRLADMVRLEAGSEWTFCGRGCTLRLHAVEDMQLLQTLSITCRDDKTGKLSVFTICNFLDSAASSMAASQTTFGTDGAKIVYSGGDCRRNRGKCIVFRSVPPDGQTVHGDEIGEYVDRVWSFVDFVNKLYDDVMPSSAAGNGSSVEQAPAASVDGDGSSAVPPGQPAKVSDESEASEVSEASGAVVKIMDVATHVVDSGTGAGGLSFRLLAVPSLIASRRASMRLNEVAYRHRSGAIVTLSSAPTVVKKQAQTTGGRPDEQPAAGVVRVFCVESVPTSLRRAVVSATNPGGAYHICLPALVLDSETNNPSDETCLCHVSMSRLSAYSTETRQFERSPMSAAEANILADALRAYAILLNSDESDGPLGLVDYHAINTSGGFISIKHVDIDPAATITVPEVPPPTSASQEAPAAEQQPAPDAAGQARTFVLDEPVQWRVVSAVSRGDVIDLELAPYRHGVRMPYSLGIPEISISVHSKEETDVAAGVIKGLRHDQFLCVQRVAVLMGPEGSVYSALFGVAAPVCDGGSVRDNVFDTVVDKSTARLLTCSWAQ